MNYRDMSREELRYLQSQLKRSIDLEQEAGFSYALGAIFGEEDSWALRTNTIFNEGEIFNNRNGVEYIVLQQTVGEETLVEARTKSRGRYLARAIRYVGDNQYEWRSSEFLGFYGG